jgi:hypothetical protein
MVFLPNVSAFFAGPERPLSRPENPSRMALIAEMQAYHFGRRGGQ